MLENNICYLLALNNQQISVDTDTTYVIEGKKESDVKKQEAPSNYSKFSEVPEDKIYKCLRDIEIESSRFSVLCEDRGTQEENAFQIQRLEGDVLKELSSVSSQMSVLRRYANMAKTKQPDVRTNKEIIKAVHNSLVFLIFFVGKSSLDVSVENALKSEGVPILSRQRMVRDFLLIETLTDILYYMFKFEIIVLEKLGDVDEDVMKVFTLCYKCIMVSIKDYQPNELYAS
jgi:hypothetical protein